MAKIHLNNCEFHYELRGKGPPVILIAGYTCNHSFWDPILKSLSQKFQILTFDNRAVGQTKDNQEKLSAELMAEDVMALAEALQLVRPHIAGHSMGGTIAQCIGAKYSPKISKLAILSSSPKWRSALILSTRSLLEMRRQNCPFDLVAEATLPWIFGENFLNNRQAVEELKTTALNYPFPQSIQDQERQHSVLTQFDGRHQLQKILAKTLIVYGSQDVAALPCESKYMAKSIPQNILKELDCGHGMILEQPEQLAELLGVFF